MKNLFAILALVGVFALASCGGSKKDDEKAKQDSIKKADSIAKIKEDSIKKAEELEKARLDSIAQAKEDSIKAAENKGGNYNYKPTNNTNTTTTTTKTTSGTPVRGNR